MLATLRTIESKRDLRHGVAGLLGNDLEHMVEVYRDHGQDAWVEGDSVICCDSGRMIVKTVREVTR